MGRGDNKGDNNLLFNPPLIRKPDPGVMRGGSGAFSSPIQNLWTTPNFTMAACQNGAIHFLDDEMMPTSDKLGVSHLNEASLFSVSDMGIAWGGDEGFLIRNFANKNAPSVFKMAPPGKALGLQISADSLWTLALDQSGEEVHLMRSEIDLGDAAWTIEATWPSYGQPRLLSKGENSLLLAQDNVQGRDVLVTLTHSGPGWQLNIADRPEISGFQEAIERCLLQGDPPGSLIAPAEEKNHYFALKEKEGQVTLTLLFPFQVDTSSMLIKLAPEAENIPFISRAEERSVTSLQDLQSTTFREMQSHRDRGALLGDKELVLFNQEGILEIIPLDPTLDSAYDRLSLTSSKAVLWSAGNPNYQEIRLP